MQINTSAFGIVEETYLSQATVTGASAVSTALTGGEGLTPVH